MRFEETIDMASYEEDTLTNVSLIDDKDTIINHIIHHIHSLEHASDRLRDDKEVVVAAVKENGRAHRYASYYL